MVIVIAVSMMMLVMNADMHVPGLALLAPQSGALKISAYRDSHPIHPSIHPTYSFRAFKPFYSDQKQCM